MLEYILNVCQQNYVNTEYASDFESDARSDVGSVYSSRCFALFWVLTHSRFTELMTIPSQYAPEASEELKIPTHQQLGKLLKNRGTKVVNSSFTF